MTEKRHRGLTEQAAQTAIDQSCKMLRLPTIRGQFGDLAADAARDQMSYLGFLAELLMAECDDRARRRSERRIKAAAFPREKSLRAFDFDANSNIDPATVHTLATCEWVKKGQAALPDRRLGHRQVAPAHRAGHRGRFFDPPDRDQVVDDELGRGAWLRTRLVSRRSAPCAYQVTDAQRWLGPPVSRCLR
ncbi:ATP-binding protein [Actinomadura sp. 6N118]|uniref:ATP-binding protein n=1 Tax=Actinomadura sp. 6N118 TaxID=3375151 RepID=UPI00378840C7